jgi:organic radical activating enzyme
MENTVLENATLDRKLIPPHRVFFSWYISNVCNYKCSFCTPENIKTISVDLEQWVIIWDGIYDRYGECHIHISGGEPFIYPKFMELIACLSRKHTLEFSTNLSCDIKSLIDNISPKRASLGGSFHPEFANFNQFFRKVALLKRKGFNVWINYVAYPPHLKDMAKYKMAFATSLPGVFFVIQPFSGKYAGCDYPQGYTAEEKKLMEFNENSEVNKGTIDWRTDDKKSSVKGKFCRMGQMYARIYPNAEVYRCCGNGASRLGNLVDRTFRLSEEAVPCECDNCPCWKCMLVGKEDYWKNHWRTPHNFT